MRYSSPIVLVIIVLISACSSSKRNPAHSIKSFQAVSALGDTLYALQPSVEINTKLQAAQKAYENHPDSTKMLMGYASLMVGQHQYRQAIRVYSKGIQAHPKDERLYEKRGQAYIITRQFDNAVTDLEKAAHLMSETSGDTGSNSDSMINTDVWLQLGIAQYLRGNYEEAIGAFQKSLDKAPANTMRVKASYWLYMSLRRAGHDLQAGKILEPIHADMKITENATYLKLLLVFKGDFDEKSLLNNADSPQKNATIGYGLGNWHYINGRKEHAKELFRMVYGEKSQWDKAGFIAAETDLARLGF